MNEADDNKEMGRIEINIGEEARNSTKSMGVQLRAENTLFVTAEIVAKDLGVSKPFAYKLVRQMNDELNAKGYLTVAGRVSRKYYEERFYGLKEG